MNDELLQKIRKCPTLPALPTIAIQLLELASKPDLDMGEIAQLITNDPAISSRILRTVNSSFYALSNHVGTINHALVILGLHAVKTLVLGYSLASSQANSKHEGINKLHYWPRSIYAATAARAIAARKKKSQQEELFLAALLQDVGMLVLAQVLGKQYDEVCAKVSTHTELIKTETEMLDATHAEVGALLAKDWKFPISLVECIAGSHDPGLVKDRGFKELAHLVQVAGWCADVFVTDEPALALLQARSGCREAFDMTEQEADQLLDEISVKTKEIAGIFDANVEASKDFEAIAKKATQTLAELTTQAKQKSAAPANAAGTPAATATEELCDRAALDQFIATHLAKSVKENKPLTVALIGVDQLKSIHEKFGQSAADQAMRNLGRLIGTMLRKEDLAARYDQGTIALVLPSMPRTNGAALAESVRCAVCASPLFLMQRRIDASVSIGVAAFEPNSPLRQAAHLYRAAELALGAARASGENCVKVFSTKNAA